VLLEAADCMLPHEESTIQDGRSMTFSKAPDMIPWQKLWFFLNLCWTILRGKTPLKLKLTLTRSTFLKHHSDALTLQESWTPLGSLGSYSSNIHIEKSTSSRSLPSAEIYHVSQKLKLWLFNNDMSTGRWSLT
jgi:hypothetical protein